MGDQLEFFHGSVQSMVVYRGPLVKQNNLGWQNHGLCNFFGCKVSLIILGDSACEESTCADYLRFRRNLSRAPLALVLGCLERREASTIPSTIYKQWCSPLQCGKKSARLDVARSLCAS